MSLFVAQKEANGVHHVPGRFVRPRLFIWRRAEVWFGYGFLIN